MATANHEIRTVTLLALALLAAVAPFAIDLYLPAFPAMVSELTTTATGVQLSLTTFLVGAGVGQVIFGPWSDRVGRRGPLLAGLVLYVAASLAATFAPTVSVLIGARLLQGLGGAAGMVLGRAIILDRLDGRDAARALNVMMLIAGVAPVVAPLVGAVLVDPLGWRGLLGIVAGLGVVSLVATLAFVQESLPRASRTFAAPTRERGSWQGLLSRGYLGYTAAFAFGNAIMMAYISASPFVYQRMIGLSATQYGFAFAVNSISLALATALAARLARRFSVAGLAKSGLLASVTAILVILVLTVCDAPPVWLMAPLTLAIAPLGLVYGNATALALGAAPGHAIGTASAFLGLLQFGLAGTVASVVGIAGEGTTLPLALTMLACGILALSGLTVAGRRA